jgi:hypothetical protein
LRNENPVGPFCRQEEHQEQGQRRLGEVEGEARLLPEVEGGVGGEELLLEVEGGAGGEELLPEVVEGAGEGGGHRQQVAAAGAEQNLQQEEQLMLQQMGCREPALHLKS